MKTRPYIRDMTPVDGPHADGSESSNARKPAGRPLAAGAAIIVLAVLPAFLHQVFYLHLAVLIAINVIAVAGLSILTRAGQISLCHGAFIGIGTYTSTLVSMRIGMPFAVAALTGAALAGLIAYALGLLILRLRGVYFVLVTFAFGELVRLVLLEWESLTGGANGIAGIPPAALPGITLDSKLSFYMFAAVLAVICIGGLRLLFASPAGHAIDAVGENPALAEASGLSVQRTQRFSFAVASGLGGLSGALLAHYVGFVSPETFNFNLSVAMIIMLVVGGRNYVLGPMVGALIMTPLPELFRDAVQTQNILYGCALILILRFMPQGLAGLAGLCRSAQLTKGDAQ